MREKTFMTSPVFILVHPQLGENIGAAARALLNCGLRDLRLVAPRDGWPNPAAWPASSGAQEVLERAQVFSTVQEAVADLSFLYATTGRERDLIKERVSLSQALATFPQKEQEGHKIGILFGSERTGLENEAIAWANQILSIPLNPQFSSLNLGQAVLLVAHGYFLQTQQGREEEAARGNLRLGKTRWAEKAEVEGLLSKIIGHMEARHPGLKTPRSQGTWLSLQNFLNRCPFTFQEVQSLHRVVNLLVDPSQGEKEMKGHKGS